MPCTASSASWRVLATASDFPIRAPSKARGTLSGSFVPERGRPLRIWHAFDPRWQAVLLLGGDKTGNDWFYDEMIPGAERLWSEYLSELE